MSGAKSCIHTIMHIPIPWYNIDASHRMTEMYKLKEVIPMNDRLSNTTAFAAQRIGVGIHCF